MQQAFAFLLIFVLLVQKYTQYATYGRHLSTYTFLQAGLPLLQFSFFYLAAA